MANETTQTETRKCHKKNILQDAHIRIEVNEWWRWQRNLTTEKRAEYLDEECRKFMEFLRDHRHQDVTGADVIREYQDVCSECRNEWESWYEDGITSCAHCGAIVESEKPKDA